MPINYANYPPNWKTEIRPRILARAKYCCERCNIKNHIWVVRGRFNGAEAYEDIEGDIYSAADSSLIGSGIGGIECHIDKMAIRVVLTIAHLNHNISDNRDENLAALCQRCHNRHDAKYRASNRMKKVGQIELFQE